MSRHCWTSAGRRPGASSASSRRRARRPRAPARYVFPSCPFTSGNAHLGHARIYSVSDAFARFRRAMGDQILFTTGFDSFGLPSELEAIRRGITPAEWVEQCCENFRRDFSGARRLVRLGALVRHVRGAALPVDAVPLPAAARARPDLPPGAPRPLVRLVPDRARADAGRGRRLLALRQPRRLRAARAVVLPRDALRGRERRQPRHADRLGRERARRAALAAEPRGGRRGRRGDAGRDAGRRVRGRSRTRSRRRRSSPSRRTIRGWPTGSASWGRARRCAT